MFTRSLDTHYQHQAADGIKHLKHGFGLDQVVLPSAKEAPQVEAVCVEVSLASRLQGRALTRQTDRIWQLLHTEHRLQRTHRRLELRSKLCKQDFL